MMGWIVGVNQKIWKQQTKDEGVTQSVLAERNSGPEHHYRMNSTHNSVRNSGSRYPQKTILTRPKTNDSQT